MIHGLEGNHRFRGIVIDDPWKSARQESSVFPDIDQMLCDVGPVIDARLDAWLASLSGPLVSACGRYMIDLEKLLDARHPIR